MKIQILVLMSVLTFQVQAEVATGEEIYVLPGIGGRKQGTPRANFTAKDYFAPIKSSEDRSKWPRQLTLTPDASMALEQIKAKMLESKWKLVFHCDGQAIPVEKFRGSSFLDGVVEPSVIYEYSEKNGKMFLGQVLYPGEENSNGSGRKIYRGYDVLSLKDIDSGKIEVLFMVSNRLGAQHEYQMVRVKETGEILLEIKNSGEAPDHQKICPDRTDPKSLLVPLSAPLMS